jgi:hypothetical protein
MITDGKINFMSDSNHALSGKTVDLPDWDEDDEGEVRKVWET